jgi:hypothetical protein
MISSLLFAYVASMTVGPNLIDNGSFENGAVKVCPPPARWCVSSLPEGIAPWYTSSSNKVYELDSSPSPWQASHGQWSVDLSGNNPYTLSQKVKTVKDKQYTVSFMLNQNRCGPATKTGFMSADAALVNFSHVNTEGWKKVALTFTATGQETIISIGSTTTGSCGPVADDVQMRRALKCDSS